MLLARHQEGAPTLRAEWSHDLRERFSPQLTIIKEIATTYHTYRQAEENILKITYWFLMDCTDESPLTPQIEEGIEFVEWKNEQAVQLALENTYPNIKLVLKNI